MHILLVDDNADIVRLVAQVLDLEGHKISIARDGLEALQQFQMNQPDAVVLDVNMPRLEGWDVCRHIKQHSKIPVMLLTVHAEKADLQKVQDVGADAYLAKPFDIPTFIHYLNQMLKTAYGSRNVRSI